MNLHELISSDEPFIAPCCTHFPVDYQITYGKSPVLIIRWESLDPLDVHLLEAFDEKTYGFRINTLAKPVQTLSLLNCFQQIVGDRKFACSSNGYLQNLYCQNRGIFLEIISMMPMDIWLLDDGNDLGSGGIRITFKSLEDYEDFKNLLAGILYWPLTERTGWFR